MKKFLALALFGVFALVASPAHAIELGLFDGTPSSGTLPSSTTLFSDSSSAAEAYTGSVAANTELRIYFSVTSGVLGEDGINTATSAGYAGSVGNNAYVGGSTANLSTLSADQTGSSVYNASGSLNGVGSTALLIATAVALDSQHAYISILNNSPVVAHFSSTYTSTVSAGLASGYTVTYTATAVPLPAALPLFGMALMGLAARRKARKQTV